MEQMIADLMMGTVVGGVIIILGFVLGVLWAGRWD
jgi:flagellar biogenesis protein FliO